MCVVIIKCFADMPTRTRAHAARPGSGPPPSAEPPPAPPPAAAAAAAGGDAEVPQGRGRRKRAEQPIDYEEVCIE